MFEEIRISSTKRQEFIDVTNLIEKIVKKNKLKNGFLFLYVPHTTAGILINENYDPSVKKDILNKLNAIAPYQDNYFHTEGNADAHIKASIVATSAGIVLQDGELMVGRWQGIFFCEFDGPRERKIIVKFIKE